jgi:O-antigen ligase
MGKAQPLLFPLLMSTTIALGFVVAEGSTPLLERLAERHPLEHRSDVAEAAIQMAKARPVDGFGLGSFPIVYPQFQTFDSNYYINHAHNDYIEIASEGGIIALIFFGGLISLSISGVLNHAWGFGTLALLIHSLTDFPIYRTPVAALFAVLVAGVAAAAKKERRAEEIALAVRIKRIHTSVEDIANGKVLSNPQ